MTDYLIYDCEIIKCIPPKNGQKDPRFKYCEGWDDFQNMGISVIGTVNLEGELVAYTHRSFLYTAIGQIANGLTGRISFRGWTSARDIREVLEHKKLVGFNSFQFDDNLMQNNGVVASSCYDVLQQIRISAFGSPSWKDTPSGYSYALDAIARANGMAKSGSGALAPELWQQGKYLEVIQYCLNDCEITRKILLLGLEGKLVDPNTGSYLKLAPLP